MRKAFLGAMATAIAACALMAPGASAAGQMKMMIREYYPGGADNDSYVVLQAWAPNQTQLTGHFLTWVTYVPTGGAINGKYVFPNDVTNSANQATVLIADDGYTGTPAPDFVVPNLTLYKELGNLCMDYEQEQVEPYGILVTDCFGWGGGGGAGADPVFGYPAFMLGGVPAGKAGRRSIGLGCPTYLERADKSGQANNEFFSAPPAPRNNASAITETTCSPPNSGINSATVREGETTSETSVRIAFSASKLADTTFECKLDSGAFTPCVSPVEYTALDGDDTASGTPHKFEVRATNVNGVEQTPATLNWIVNTNPSLLAVPEGDGIGSAAAAAAVPAAAASQPAAVPSLQSAPTQRASAKKKHKKRRAKRGRRAHG